MSSKSRSGSTKEIRQSSISLGEGNNRSPSVKHENRAQSSTGRLSTGKHRNTRSGSDKSRKDELQETSDDISREPATKVDEETKYEKDNRSNVSGDKGGGNRHDEEVNDEVSERATVSREQSSPETQSIGGQSMGGQSMGGQSMGGHIKGEDSPGLESTTGESSAEQDQEWEALAKSVHDENYQVYGMNYSNNKERALSDDEFIKRLNQDRILLSVEVDFLKKNYKLDEEALQRGTESIIEGNINLNDEGLTAEQVKEVTTKLRVLKNLPLPELLDYVRLCTFD